MKYTWKVFVASSIIALNACAPINTQFSCNETAGDRCLSIEEVNAMTEKMTRMSPFQGLGQHAKPVNQIGKPFGWRRGETVKDICMKTRRYLQI